MNKPFLVLTVFLLAVGSSAVFVHAQTFTVPPLSQQTVNVNLNRGDCVNGTFSALGGTGTGIDFKVTDPNGKELLSYNYTSSKAFSFSATANGTYKLCFDNSFCSCEGGKNVTLDYSVNTLAQGSIEAGSNKGFPVAMVLISVAVAAIIVIAAVVTITRRPKQKAKSGNLKK